MRVLPRSCWSTALSLFLANRLDFVSGHGTLVSPIPRQPESMYWYQVGCAIGCECSGGGKEDYPDLEEICEKAGSTPANATLPLSASTWNSRSESPRGDWNALMPWRSPGTAVPLDMCGIASGFLPSADVQYPHEFAGTTLLQGTKGSSLPRGGITEWIVGEVVEASWHLVVNHGGGYQYRVSKYLADGRLSDDLVPLAFADDVHVVSFGSRAPFEIPATDVTVGVTPEGAAWRRLPLPACNCDSGAGCAVRTSDSTGGAVIDDFIVTYSNGTKPHGTCLTGLQFEAPHLTDGTWPEGYGYYVATLKHEEYAMSPCEQHEGPDTCRVDSACDWYEEKNACYKTSDQGGDGGGNGGKGCSAHKDQNSCVGNVLCTWYESDAKKVCYEAKTRRRSLQKQEEKTSWHITDRLVAPSEPGDYVLQWRWDNEQTPQVWTTCADIKVVEKGGESSGCLSSRSAAVAMLMVATMATVVGHGAFV